MDTTNDYYEILQISPNAEPETIHRVYRMLAQRYHPDSGEGGNIERFRTIVEAYRVLSDPQERARYDIVHTELKQQRWRLASRSDEADNDFEAEQVIRLVVLELLYTRRRTEPDKPGLSILDLESLTGRAREHLEFTMWYLTQKMYITRSDGAVMTITADGAEYLEQRLHDVARRRRLHAGQTPPNVVMTPDSAAAAR